MIFIAETILTLALACPPRRTTDREVDGVWAASDHCAFVLTNDRLFQPETLISLDLESALSRDLTSIPQVRHVMTDREDSNVLVWVAIDDPTPEVRQRVYQKELELIDGFPEIDFDFNLVPSMGRTAAEFASFAQLVYPRERQ